MQFQKKKYSPIANPNSTEVSFTEIEGDFPGSFKIIANASGVMFSGDSVYKLKTPEDFENFAKALGDAAQNFTALRKAIREKLQ